MKKNLKNRILAILLSAAMLAVEAPAAFADDLLPEEPAVVETEESEIFEDGAEDLFTDADEDEDLTEDSFTDEDPGIEDEELFDDIEGEDDADASLDDERTPNYEITYLSPNTVKQFNSDELTVYRQFCADAEAIRENNPEFQDIIISVDKSGEISLSYFVPYEILKTSLQMEEEDLPAVIEETEDSESEESEEVFDPEYVIKDTITDTEEVTEEDFSDNVGTDSLKPVTDEIGEVTEDTEGLSDAEKEAKAAEDKTPEAVEESSEEYIEENMDLAAAAAVQEVEIEGDSLVDIDSLFADSDINFFRKKLEPREQKIFDAGKASVVKGHKNSLSASVYYGFRYDRTAGAYLSQGLSALILTYPGSFGWLDKSKSGGYRASCGWRWGSGYRTSVTLKKSKHYNGTLNSKANKQIKKLVNEAYAYASQKYPNNPTYGIIDYFDNWICDENYYNYTGVSVSKSVMAKAPYYYCHSKYGILLKGYGVCESYALAMSALLDSAGIRNVYVVGKGDGEGHAWNYVQMPDGKYYMLDSTWNDNPSSGSTKGFFLTKMDGRHVSHGRIFTSGYDLGFPAVNSANYTRATESFYLNKNNIYLTPKKSVKLKLTNDYYSKYRKNWSSSDTKVVTVSKNGKVTAKGPGRAVITCRIAGKTTTSTITVYQFTKLTFPDGKTSVKSEYGNPDSACDANDVTTYSISVGQKNKVTNAVTIMNNAGLAAPKVSYSKKGVATATATLSGDTITLRVQPQKFGSTKIKVKFAGKTATLNYSCKKLINQGMFDLSAITKANNTVYTGKAIKPAVKKSASAPKDLKYSVSYKNNTNAGTATVIIKGKDKYTGTIERPFTIARKNLADANVTGRMNAKRTYNGKAAGPNTVIKVGKKTLKRGKDYDLSCGAPINAGTCQVTVSGMGNYSGSRPLGTFEITKAKAKKVKVSCSSTVKFDKKKGGGACPKVKVMLGKNALQKGTDYTLIYRSVTNPGATYGETALLPKGKYQAEVTYTSRNLDLTGTTGKVIKKFTVK
ncbi:MAG: Ig-like domain-containing protein [Lachnospiraceae bacterium]|nr:Ig-like domain-containing protein [Lachnospiraceae bacterium]